jgi:hypothetical protein
MKNIPYVILFSSLLLLNSCIAQFIPETNEDQELLVVEGLITDQPGPNTVKLSKSMPLGYKKQAIPLGGCTVWITDDIGGNYTLYETIKGTYITDPLSFQGTIGRFYTLHLITDGSYSILNYESLPMELKPVPRIDSIYYEKTIIQDRDGYYRPSDGCQIYLNTHDPANYCNYYRWEFSETWEFRLPWPDLINRICWLSANSTSINIKNTSVLEEATISKFPLHYISNKTDRLQEKYSILVNQYSLNEDEFIYWEKLKNISEAVGGLYDITPSAIPSNIWCIEDPNYKVLGYFSVSAISSKRIFIKDYFSGSINLYSECISDTIYGHGPIPGLDVSVWVLDEIEDIPLFYRLITWNKGCADCTVRGSNVEPLFWRDDEK